MKRALSVDSKKDESKKLHTEQAIHPFFNQSATMARVGIKWFSVAGSLLAARTKDPVGGRTKVAAFDLDGTLIDTKSGRAYAKDEYDWQWWDKSIPSRLTELHNDGYKIVIFSNQNGLRNDQRIQEFKNKVKSMLSQIHIPVYVLAALLKDKYRKPATGMWDYLENNENEGITIDKDQSFYVGDAAGRAQGWKPKARKDHSCSDRKFAANIGIPFYTAEEYFLKETAAPFAWGTFNPREHLAKNMPLFTPASTPLVPVEPHEIVVLVGYPACGKSSFAKKYLIPNGYHYINQDLMKSKGKCLNACSEALKNNLPVVIDNTNPDAETRARYVKLAEAAGISIRCFYFTADEHLARHNNQYRAIHTPSEGRELLSGVVFNVFKSRLQKPDLNEGFSEIKLINFVFQGTAEDRQAWEQWWS